MDLSEVLKKPIITEKSMDGVAKNRYTFEVAKKANKIEIKKAVEKFFKVDVLDVKTAIIRGKKVRSGRKRRIAQRSSYKKAVVTVKEGQKIDIFETG